MASVCAPKKLLYQMTDKPQNDRQILAQGRIQEMLVHLERARQQFLEVVHADVQRNRQADGRPQRVAPADPVLEREHVFGVDAELGDLFRVRGQRDEVFGDCARVPVRHALQQPRFRRRGVRDGLLRGERFRGDEEQRGFGIAEFKSFH